MVWVYALHSRGMNGLLLLAYPPLAVQLYLCFQTELVFHVHFWLSHNICLLWSGKVKIRIKEYHSLTAQLYVVAQVPLRLSPHRHILSIPYIHFSIMFKSWRRLQFVCLRWNLHTTLRAACYFLCASCTCSFPRNHQVVFFTLVLLLWTLMISGLWHKVGIIALRDLCTVLG